MNHKLINQRLKQAIIDLANELDVNLSALAPDDILYIFNENELYIVDIESYTPREDNK